MPAECARMEKNLDRCNCTYPGCPRKGICCECIHYHLKMNQVPACFFPPEEEKTYDRSFKRFAQNVVGKY